VTSYINTEYLSGGYAEVISYGPRSEVKTDTQFWDIAYQGKSSMVARLSQSDVYVDDRYPHLIFPA